MTATAQPTQTFTQNLTTDSQAAAAIANSATWEDAVRDLVGYLTQAELPFSSGEIVATLRTVRPEFRFSATNGVGRMVRDMFYAGDIEYNDGFGNFPASQVPRTTVGKYPQRTAAGLDVFVYAPDQVTGDSHEFEIYVPRPGETGPVPAPAPVAATPAPAPSAPASSAPAPFQPGVQGVPSGIDLRATVHIDGRVCVTRAAFEELVHATKSTIPYGTPVFVRFDGDLARIGLDANQGGKQHELTRRGRILFNGPVPFKQGCVFKVSVDAASAELVVDLSKNLKL